MWLRKKHLPGPWDYYTIARSLAMELGFCMETNQGNAFTRTCLYRDDPFAIRYEAQTNNRRFPPHVTAP